MISVQKAILLGAVSLALSACGSDDVVPPGPDPDPTTTLDHLVDADPYFMMFGDEAESTMTVRIDRGDGWETHDIALELRSGHVAFEADHSGAMDIDGFELYYADIVIGAGDFPPNGLHLSDIQLSLVEPKACEQVSWTDDGDYCTARVETPLLLSWSLVTGDGTEHPLGTQQLDGMGVTFDIYQMVDPGQFGGRMMLALETSAHAPGVIWEWGGMIEFSNLRLTAYGSELIPLSQ